MLRIGTASEDITPRTGVELCGYGFYLRRAATGTLDRLMARALYAESDEGRVLFIGNDLIGVDAELTQRTRRLCRRHLGLSDEAVMLAGTHTHSGPATIAIYGCGEKDPQYYDHLPYAWLDVARRAVAAARPAAMRLARGSIDPVGYDRHDPEGPLDRALRVARFDVDGRTAAVLINYSAHGVMFGRGNTQISGDWPGVLERSIEASLPGSVGIFAQGSCGTINCQPACLSFDEGVPRIEEVGRRVAEAALTLVRSAHPGPDACAVSCAAESVPLPYRAIPQPELVALRDEHLRQWNDHTLDAGARNTAHMYAGAYQHMLDLYAAGEAPEFCAAEIQVLRIGPLRIVGIPGELFMALGQRIIDAGEMTMVAGYANDFLGYLPTREAYGDPRYAYPTEVVPAMRGAFPFQAGAAELLVERALALADRPAG